MKKLSLFLASLFISIFALAQSPNNTPAQEATNELVQVYQLDAKQTGEMLTIQERKYRNLEEIKDLKSTEPQTYILKMRNIQYAIEKSIMNMLNGEQKAILQQKQMERRKKKAELYQQLKEQGLSEAVINSKIIEYELSEI